MKRQTFPIAAAAALLLTACDFSIGTKTDLNTGLSFNYNGFRVADVYLSDSAGNKLPGREVPYGNRVGLVVTGMTGFTPLEGKVYPGFTVDITDEDGNKVLTGPSPDLFAQNNGFTPQEASILLGSIKIDAPLKAGNTYRLKAHVWDKNNSDNTVDAEAEIKVK